MKLLNLTNRYYIAIALVLLLVSSAFLAYRVLYLVDNEISEHMLFEKSEIAKQLEHQKGLQNLHLIFGDRIEIEPIPKFTSFRVNMTDTTFYDLYEKGKVPYRMMSYEQLVDGKSYRIKLARRLTETEQLAEGILATLLLVALDIIACFYFLNRWFSSKIWNPFYRALNVLKTFDLQKGGNTMFQRSQVDEFNALNAELSKLTDKVTRDYKNLREFTENMSHETQTPLAIIRSKLELLLQSELNETQLNQILSTLDSVNRLSKMNKGLIMLTRIDNDQYAGLQLLQMGKLLRKQLEDLELFISSKNIQLHENIDDKLLVRMNPHLADILLTNLLSNAIKYNLENGDLFVTFTKEKFEIANSGHAPVLSPDEVFDRFKKGESPDSIGLGLAIVRKIIDHIGAKIKYEYKADHHVFSITIPVANLIDQEEEYQVG
ncbi:MAG TPA: HAMP domain-containing sensor histidine kinase [Bacteroidia bacterium]|nr:HAMP domain-containing sensor histidine kinase [Bacteroidia bacterium]